MGPDVKIYIGDMFDAKMWNDGFWEDRGNTFLDSRYYHGKIFSIYLNPNLFFTIHSFRVLREILVHLAHDSI